MTFPSTVNKTLAIPSGTLDLTSHKKGGILHIMPKVVDTFFENMSFERTSIVKNNELDGFFKD